MRKKAVSLFLAAVITAGTLFVPTATAEAATWKKNTTGWWWQEDNGSWPANEWRKVNGVWYWFDPDGYMATGWRLVNGKWYYLQPGGAMAGEGWHWIGGKCYYMYSSGAMAADTWIGNYYVDGSGAWVPDKTKAQAGWIQSGSRWWYRHTDGSYTRNGWEQIGGKWYHFDSAGWMEANKWIGNYYVTGSGAMATNTWIGIYYVGADGAWIPEKSQGSASQTTQRQQSGWIQSGNRWWYRHTDGSYTKNGWEQIGGKWYHFDSAGWMEANKWVGNYYVTGSGAMATNTWIGNDYVGADGAWIPGKTQQSVSQTTQTHTHDWKAQTRTIYHPAVTEQTWVVDREAYDEEVPVFKLIEHEICNGCGMDFKGLSEDDIDVHFKESAEKYMAGEIDKMCGGYHSEWINEQVGTELVHHDTEGHYDTKVIEAEWTETVTTGYICSGCGVAK